MVSFLLTIFGDNRMFEAVVSALVPLAVVDHLVSIKKY